MQEGTTVGRECGASAHTARNYFQILEDTLLGRWLPAYRKRPKRRVQQSPKFYFSDVGVVNLLTRRWRLELGSELFGKAFENWVMHELTAYNHYRERYLDLHYWRLASGVEVDFVVGALQIAIEAKATKRVHNDHLKGLREIKEEYPSVAQRIVVCLEPKGRRLEDGTLIVPYQQFIHMLWSGELF